MKNYIDVEGSAKNINDALEKAVEKALAQLKLPREEVTYELIDQKKGGLFGLGEKTAKVRVFYDAGPARKAEAFLKGLFEQMKVNANMTIEEEEDRVNVTLEGDDMGIIIGRRGETLDAVQYITALAINRGEEKFVKVSINSENYREKREDYLKRIAEKTAERVLRYNRSIALEPMVSHDRRIIHATVQEIEGVTTFSTGQDPNRRVIIAPENANGEPAAPAEGGEKSGSSETGRSRSGNRGRNGYRPRGSRGGRRGGHGKGGNRNNNAAQQPAEPTAPAEE